VLLPLIGIHGVYSQVQPTPVVTWDKHALRLNAHQLCKLATRMELFHTDTDYSTLILGVFLFDHIAMLGSARAKSLELFGSETILEVFQPI